MKFPAVGQVWVIQRQVTDLSKGKSRRETVCGLTSLSVQQADPARLLDLNRGHWSIENRLHWVRDVTYDEDRCRIRRGAGPRVMASLRNLAITLLRMAGAFNIAQALRYCARYPVQTLRRLGLALS